MSARSRNSAVTAVGLARLAARNEFFAGVSKVAWMANWFLPCCLPTICGFTNGRQR